MSKSGLVVDTNKKYACLLSSDGQFINVAIKGRVPLKGEIYSGEVYKKTPIYRFPLIAAMVAFIIFLSGGFYTYYTPAAEITISMNPAVKLKLNLWHKIIESVPLNKDGEKLLSSLQLKNKDLNAGLDLIVKQAKADKFIDETSVENEEVISIEVTKNKSLKFNLSKFEQSVKAQNLKVQILDETKGKHNSKKSNSKAKLNEDKNEEIKNNKDIDNKTINKENTDKDNNDNLNDKDSNKNKTNKDTKKPVDNNSSTRNTDKKEKEKNDKSKTNNQTGDIKAFNEDNKNTVHSTSNSKVKSYKERVTKVSKDKKLK
jgi:hypothetical protein